MKGLTRSSLALAVALATGYAHADFQALDEMELSGITGQAGVTIELETKVNIGEFVYTDEGSLSVKDITLGGASQASYFGGLVTIASNDKLDNMKIVIDVLRDGDAVINFLPIDFSPIDFKVTTGEWSLVGNTDSTLLVDNLNVVGLMGRMSMRVDTATDQIDFKIAFAIDDLDVDVPFLAVGIRDLKMTGANYDTAVPSPLDLFVDVDTQIYKKANAAGNDSLAIDIQKFDADVSIGGVLVGGTSIGSFFIDDLSLQNTSLVVYGH